jgi:uncharacterized protein YyaL (SSP411 family)
MLTGRGGWPMSVFLTPELEPFYGGTYWPESARGGMPGFDQILSAVAEAWQSRRGEIAEQAAELTRHLHDERIPGGDGKQLSPQLIAGAAAALERSFDPRHGGFGGAPKFPHPMDLRLLLRAWRRSPKPNTLNVVTVTLDKMAAGGIYDHLGGGFHRYSVDERWLVPHFEKMLYDNALLASCYLDAYLATEREDYARVVRETLDYLLRDMRDPAGGFYSTEDADSEGEEGKFYVWTPEEIRAALGNEAGELFCYVYDVSDVGNFEGQNILNLPKSIEQCARLRNVPVAQLEAELGEWRAKLFDIRGRRIRPGRDEKVLASWNGLAIDALASAAAALDEPRYRDAAKAAADFVLTQMHSADGKLLHTWRGEAKVPAFLDDYACATNGLISLYEAGFDERYIDDAVRLADIMLSEFFDSSAGGFFYTAANSEQLIARQKDWQDSSTPSGNAMAATVLLRLAKLAGRGDYLDAAVRTLQAAAGLMERFPSAAGQMLGALDFHLGPTPEIVIASPKTDDAQAVTSALQRRYIPNKVVAVRSAGKSTNRSPALEPLFAGKHAAGEPTLYLCKDFACQAPVIGEAAALEAIAKLAGVAP